MPRARLVEGTDLKTAALAAGAGELDAVNADASGDDRDFDDSEGSAPLYDDGGV